MALTEYRVLFECVTGGARIGTVCHRGHQPEDFAAAKQAAELWVEDVRAGGYLDASAKITTTLTVLDPAADPPLPLPAPEPNEHGQIYQHSCVFDYVQKGGSTHRRAQLYLGYQPTEAATAHRVDQILRDFLDPVLRLAADQVEWTAAWIGPSSG